MTPEGKVKAAIRKVLDHYKSRLYYEMAVPYGYGKSGLDFTCCVNGLYFSIEAKAPGKRPTDRQRNVTIAGQKRAGAKTFVIDSTSDADVDTLEDLREWIEKALKHEPANII